MGESESRLRRIFSDALEIEDPQQREVFLARECGTDSGLRAELDELLQAEADAGHFLPAQVEHAVSLPLVSDLEGQKAEAPIAEKPGDHIGHYKLLQKIGEGGCGIVYMAEQEAPVRRKVALKIVKLGMDTRQVIARFEAERQALALMDHPNIAKVLDAGATASGRPYFVMELVRGKKITAYCDQQKLSMRQRLDLFVQVCQALQHAHQKGIIHRDLKPSNIMVTERDGVPVPKVIDFGIAKATGDLRLTDKTMFTAFEQFIGTPAYMSPEQARLGELDIDTRSDIYSLGVLLYELLTGKTPFDTQALLAAGLDELRRTILEKEPARPSTKLSVMTGEELAATASHRGVEGLRLVQLLRGDLDWIIMKCLEKDRTRRYETANGLAMDVRRYLADEPVIACPPSRLYELQKTVRRHKWRFAAGGTIAVALVLGSVASTLEALRAKRAEHEQARLGHNALVNERKASAEAAKSRQVARFLGDMLEKIVPSVARGQYTSVLRGILSETAKQVSKDFTNQPEIEAELKTTIGRVYEELGDSMPAESMFEESLALRRKSIGKEDPAIALALDTLAMFRLAHGHAKTAEPVAIEALGIRRKHFDKDPAPVAHSLCTLARVLSTKGDLAGAESCFREALAIQREGKGENDDAVLAETMDGLTDVLLLRRNYAETEVLFNEVWPVPGNGQYISARLLRVRGTVRARTGRWHQAVEDFAKVVEMEPDKHESYHLLAPLLVQTDDRDGYRRLCEQIRAHFGGTTNDPKVAERMAKDCLILDCQGRDLTIESRLADAAVILGEGSDLEPWGQFCKGLAEYRQGQFASAIAWTESALADKNHNNSSRRNVESYMVLAMANQRLMKVDKARDALTNGLTIFEPKMGSFEGGDLGGGWNDWLIARALVREAVELIVGATAPRAPLRPDSAP